MKVDKLRAQEVKVRKLGVRQVKVHKLGAQEVKGHSQQVKGQVDLPLAGFDP